MAYRPKLSSGTKGFTNEHGEFVCTGSYMGRADVLPEEGEDWPRLHLLRMDMSSCGAYDYAGAYWGSGDHKIGWMYMAVDKDNQVNIFVRATTRVKAMLQVEQKYPKANFIRRSIPD